jgi:hypothetical protein
LINLINLINSYALIENGSNTVTSVTQKKTEIMNEKLIEQKLRESVKKLGGLALKFSSPYHRGMPDRIVLMPEGQTAFAELKTTGKKPTELQKKAIAELRAMGFKAEVIDSQEGLDKFLEEISC